MRDPSSPAMLEVMVPTGTNVYPKIAFGRPITEMEPLARPVDMEGT
jgi:acetolactate synthase-1/2/3 large subunit